jgi:hypothetical protein
LTGPLHAASGGASACQQRSHALRRLPWAGAVAIRSRADLQLRRGSMSRAHALLLAPVLALTACTGGSPDDTARKSAPSARATEQPAAELARPSGVQVLDGGASGLATTASRTLYERAPVVVVAPADDRAAQARAASVAVAAGAPLLLSPAPPQPSAPPQDDPVRAELDRLGAGTVVTVGAAKSWADDLDDVEVVEAPDGTPAPAGDPLAAVAGLPLDAPAPDLDGLDDGPAERQDGLLVLASATAPDALAAVATARAAGADVHLLRGPDPRASRELVGALAGQQPSAVLALGDAFGDAAGLEQRLAVVSTGVQLPGGGQLVQPGKLYVALYGHPGSSALGVLGEQGVEQTIARAKQVAAEYEAAGSRVPVVPTLEIITTVASAALGDGDYSDESEIAHVRPLVDAAGRAGVYVVLDLQPGYDDFLTQARMYEELLALPHVGLALDPEWRLRPGERHMRQIGRVGADEVNHVVTWLADLTRDRRLPQKMLLLHQFKTFMLEDRERIDLSRGELSVITQMDGHGSPGTKQETWNVLRPGTREGMRWGWKNFYDEDTPMLTPAQTLAVEPTPVFVSYQ